jgi:UDP-N-acetylglucosamine 2-epimerase
VAVPSNNTAREEGGTKPAGTIADAMSSRCRDTRGNEITCRLILFTAHRQENHGQPFQNMLKAVILAAYADVLVVYPVHLNPNVRKAIQSSVPVEVYT